MTRQSDVTKIGETVSSVGETLKLFLRQHSQAPADNTSPEDYQFALSLAGTLSKIKSEKTKLLLKAKFLTMAAECMDENE